MRADRLVAIILLLQVRARMTVPELAERLETSERTIRRDLDALCMAGVPVYSQRGRGGGWSLVDGHRIDLSGLTADEAHALLVATGPGTATLGPGIADGLAAARRKVMAALPEALRAQAEAAAATVLIDASRWGRRTSETVGDAEDRWGDGSLLRSLRAAVVAGVQVIMEYEPPGREAQERRLHPHGLVCKRGVWYLVATAPAGLRTYRLSRVRSVRVTDDLVERPVGFDLAEAWAEIQRGLADRTPAPVVVVADVEEAALPWLRATVGSWWALEEERTDTHSVVRVTMRFASAVAAASELAGFGGRLHVLSPEGVRSEMGAIGELLVASYGSPLS